MMKFAFNFLIVMPKEIFSNKKCDLTIKLDGGFLWQIGLSWSLSTIIQYGTFERSTFKIVVLFQ